MDIIIWIIIAVVVIIILWLTITYNRLIVYRNRIENSWAQIDVQLKRRFDLIPNLVKTVKAYMKHERETFESITQARTLMTKATSVKEKAKAVHRCLRFGLRMAPWLPINFWGPVQFAGGIA